jgi:hypothetical protein
MKTKLLAAISGESLVQTVVYVICIGLVFWLLWWLLDYIKPPEPFYKVGRVLLAVAAVLFLINILMALAGRPIVRW